PLAVLLASVVLGSLATPIAPASGSDSMCLPPQNVAGQYIAAGAASFLRVTFTMGDTPGLSLWLGIGFAHGGGNGRGVAASFIEGGAGPIYGYTAFLDPSAQSLALQAGPLRYATPRAASGACDGSWASIIDGSFGGLSPGSYTLTALGASEVGNGFAVVLPSQATVTNVETGPASPIFESTQSCALATRFEQGSDRAGAEDLVGCSTTYAAAKHAYAVLSTRHAVDATHDAHWVTPSGVAEPPVSGDSFTIGAPGTWTLAVPVYVDAPWTAASGYDAGVYGVFADV
ncbi:MAG: hypothetical protein ACYDCK_12845, partial [Thermoplasmatota archaeon]